VNINKEKFLTALLILYFLIPVTYDNTILFPPLFHTFLFSLINFTALLSFILLKVEIKNCIINKRLFALLLLLPLVQIISSITSGNTYFLLPELFYFSNLIIFFWVLHIIKHITGIEQFTKVTQTAIFISLTLFLLIGFLENSGYNILSIPGIRRNGGTLGDRTMAADYLTVLIPFVLFMILNSIKLKNKPRLIFFVLLCFASFTYLLALRSRGAILTGLFCIILSFIFVVFRLNNNTREKLIYFLIIMLLISGSYSLNILNLFQTDTGRDNINTTITSVFDAGKNENISRLDYADASLKMFYSKPLFGIGTGNWYGSFPAIIQRTTGGSDTAKAKTYNYDVDDESIYYNSDLNPHNIYLEYLSENGLTGFLILILIITFTLKVSIRNIKNRSNIPFFLSFISFCFISLINFTKDNTAVMMMFIYFVVVLYNSDIIHLTDESKPRKNNFLFKLFILLISTIILQYNLFRLISERNYSEAIKLKGKSEYEKANNILKNISKYYYPADPNNIPVCFYSGVCFFELKKYNEALEMFKLADRIVPNSEMIRSNLASAYYYSNEYPNATSILQKLKTDSPYFIEPQINLAVMYFNSRNTDSARIIIREIDGRNFNTNIVKNLIILNKLKEVLK
jgi:O-antigen ligase